MARIVCISDTHMEMSKIKDLIPEGDILIHAGDLTYNGKAGEIKKELGIINSLDFDRKIIIPGNHDFLFQNNPSKARRIVKHINSIQFGAPIDVLEEEFYKIYLPKSKGRLEDEKYSLYAQVWMPNFFDWAFMLPRNGPELEEKVKNIPKDIDILVTHGPAWGYLDRNSKGENCGCEILAQYLEEGKIKPRLHVFGHIHESRGVIQRNGTIFVNAAMHGPKGQIQKPIVIDITKDKIEVVDY
jgi:Icc-related predicted phosphoesterase